MKAQNITPGEIEKLIKRELLKAAPTISGTKQKVFNKAFVKTNMQTHKQYPLTTYCLHGLHAAGSVMTIRRIVDEMSRLTGLPVASNADSLSSEDILFLRVAIPSSVELSANPQAAEKFTGELLQSYNELADKCALVVVQFDFTEADDTTILYEMNKLLLDSRCQFYPIIVTSYDEELFDAYYQSLPEAIHFFVMGASANDSTDEQLNANFSESV